MSEYDDIFQPHVGKMEHFNWTFWIWGIIFIITTQYGQDPTDELLIGLLYEANSFADGLDNKRRYNNKSKYTVLWNVRILC
jgi:hypothetical protein